MREAIGGSLRRARTEGRRTLREVSRRARVSLGYLSEVERGRKEASSELLAAICEALEISLPDVLAEAAEVIARSLAADSAEVLTPGRRPIGLRHMDLRLAGAAPATVPTSVPMAPASLPVAPVPVRGVRAAA
jgi:transcriptional regulator with XRE-family HTH domain